MSHVERCLIQGEEILLHMDSEDEADKQANPEQWRADTYASKEPDTLQWVASSVSTGQVLYDVGANIGQYALLAARKMQGGTVFAFEPEALNYAKLNRNIVLNDLVGRVIPFCVAVAGSGGYGRFFSRNSAPGAALHAWEHPVTQGDEPFEVKNEQGMVSATLDELTSELPFPSHIKIDVDGIELAIVQGAERTLRDPRLMSALVEVFMYQDHAEAILRLFEDAGFVLANADDVDYSPGIAQNLIFERSERHG